MRAWSSVPSGLANGTSDSSTSYGAVWSNRTFMGSPSLDWPSAAKRGQDLRGKPLELGELIVAHEPDAQVADPGRLVALERGSHHVRRAEAHRAARVHA